MAQYTDSITVTRQQAVAWAQHLALKSRHGGHANPRREELAALANRITEELGADQQVTIALTDREQFLTASHGPIAKHLDQCRTKWNR